MTKTHTDFYQMGLAALLPGMQHMLTLMQRELDSMKAQLSDLQTGAPRRGRPLKGESLNLNGKPLARKSPWANTTAEERSVEMKRRRAVARGESPSRRGPIGKDSELSKERKRQWAALSPAKRKQRIAAMAAGKTKRAKERGQAENGVAAA
jgi:hypothetical protein